MASTLRAWLLIAPAISTHAFCQEAVNHQGFEDCKVISDDNARLNCMRSLLQGPANAGRTIRSDPWILLRTPRPDGGPDAVSVSRTADTTKSDPDLAGLMIRCSDSGGTEILLALIRPIPPRKQKTVALAAGSSHFRTKATAIASGSALLLPDEATALANGPWQTEKGLNVTIEDVETATRGYIPLDGLSVALRNLRANCATH
jgi:hypothetical protein